MKQSYYGGIQVISGSQIIFMHDSIIKQSADQFYLKSKKILAENLLQEAKNEFKKRVGQSIVRDTLRLGDDSSMEIELIEGGIKLKYTVPDNRFRFWVTTPDVNILGFDIGASRHVDPGFEISFDLGIEMQAVNVHSIDTIQLSELPYEVRIDFEGTNITGKIAEAVVRVIDKTIAWIKNEDGFLRCYEKVSGELTGIKNEINNQLDMFVIQNQKLLEEMWIDENYTIQYDLNNDYLTLTHFHSSAGALKRNASKTVADQMTSNRERASSYDASPSAGNLSKGTRSIRG